MRRLLLTTALVVIPISARAGETKVKTPFTLVKGKPAQGKAPTGDPADLKGLVEDGLKWLASKQASDGDGRWTRSSKGQPDDDQDVIPTASAIVSFTGNGHTHRYGTYKAAVRKGVKWLLATGKTGHGVWGAKSEAPVLSQLYACQALGELYSISLDRSIKPLAVLGLEKLVAMEFPSGGFGFEPKGAPNALATSLVVLTLKTFKIAGLPIPPELLTRCRTYLEACTGQDGLVGFSGPKQGISLGALRSKKRKKKRRYAKVPLFTAGAVIARIFTGERRTTARVQSGMKQLVVAHPDRYEPLYIYLAGYAAFQNGGALWERWSKALHLTLSGKRKGDGHWGSAGVFGKLGGSVGTTALNVQALEILLRYERMRRR